MDPEQKQMLEKLLAITEQNNKILRRMHRHALWNSFFNVLYWAVIVGLAIWSFNMIQPYLGIMGNLMGKAKQLQNIEIPGLK